MEPPAPRRRVILRRTGTNCPPLVFQQIAIRWMLDPRALFRSALECKILQRYDVGEKTRVEYS